METVKVTYTVALEHCKNGRFSEELRKLYLAPYRDQVDWSPFPNWARPNDATEGCHEG